MIGGWQHLDFNSCLWYVPLNFASYTETATAKDQARDSKALQVALGMAATFSRGFGKPHISQGMGSTLEVQRCVFWVLYCPHGLLAVLTD